jgi:AraC-like DNA-binding protein
LVRGASDALDWVYGPLVVGADCTSIGPLLRQTAKALASGGGAKNQIAHQLIGGLRAELPAVAQVVLAQAAAVAGTKPATRFEMVRRANLAQAYLHGATDHAVELDELAAVVGISPFRLLAAFQHCFGESPASYHRKLRLRLVIEEAARRDMPLSAVAEQFGFAGVSSFSHTYRRVFGRAPVWSKGEPS